MKKVKMVEPGTIIVAKEQNKGYPEGFGVVSVVAPRNELSGTNYHKSERDYVVFWPLDEKWKFAIHPDYRTDEFKPIDWREAEQMIKKVQGSKMDTE